MSSDERHKFDGGDSYHSHGSFRASRDELAPQQRSPQTDRGRDRRRSNQYDHASDRNNHQHGSEDRLSGSGMQDHRWTSHDRLKMINSHSHERFDRVDDAFYQRASSNEHHKTDPNSGYERRWPSMGQERYHDRKSRYDSGKVAHDTRHHRDNEYLQKSHTNYKHREEEQEEQVYQVAKRPPFPHSYSSDTTSLEVRPKDRGNSYNMNEQQEQYPSSADRHSDQRHKRHSDGWPSSRRSSRSLSSASDNTEDSRNANTPKGGSYPERQLSQRDRRRSGSPSYSGSRPHSESGHRGRSRSSSRSKNHSSVKKHRGSSSSRKHSGKRKHKDRSASREDRKRRKHKERERDQDGETSKEKEKMKKRDDERRSVLTGKKIKLKVKKDKGDHERDANRKDLLQFLNSAFE